MLLGILCFLCRGGNRIKPDIGKKYNNIEFKIEEYLNIENKYLAAISCFLEIIEDDYLRVEELEKHALSKVKNVKNDEDLIIMFNKVNNNLLVQKDEILQISRLVLREDIWCNLTHPQSLLKIEFGYDYYLYIHCSSQRQEIVNRIVDEIGLFVEH